jgi:hypothetical protein
MFYCCRQHRISIKSLSSSEMVSGCYDWRYKCHECIQYLIQLIAHLTINNCLFSSDAPPTCFVFNRPSSGRSFKKDYVYSKFYERYAYIQLKYSVVV